ncbi:hypothetical protein PybrP1_004424 [[Pythium] brassicae (nom. inval.)]|nr:hypothetical protein PybrP1_004424 [[Pythium] brassicae (nom. inval.)]
MAVGGKRKVKSTLYYELLGIDTDATPELIKKAYRKKALQLHPDKRGNTKEAQDEFTRMKQAYDVLSDPQKKEGGRGRDQAHGELQQHEPGGDVGDAFPVLWRVRHEGEGGAHLGRHAALQLLPHHPDLLVPARGRVRVVGLGRCVHPHVGARRLLLLLPRLRVADVGRVGGPGRPPAQEDGAFQVLPVSQAAAAARTPSLHRHEAQQGRGLERARGVHPVLCVRSAVVHRGARGRCRWLPRAHERERGRGRVDHRGDQEAAPALGRRDRRAAAARRVAACAGCAARAQDRRQARRRELVARFPARVALPQLRYVAPDKPVPPRAREGPRRPASRADAADPRRVHARVGAGRERRGQREQVLAVHRRLHDHVHRGLRVAVLHPDVAARERLVRRSTCCCRIPSSYVSPAGEPTLCMICCAIACMEPDKEEEHEPEMCSPTSDEGTDIATEHVEVEVKGVE